MVDTCARTDGHSLDVPVKAQIQASQLEAALDVVTVKYSYPLTSRVSAV